MNPLYFGSSDRPLFGIHHVPQGRSARGVGVVIAHPAPAEYMRTYWALRRLSAKLAQDGFHVLRFDYSGTGDSAGELESARLDTWRADLARAVAELRERTEGLPISVVGVRLGASLALSSPQLALRDLVLWDPVVRGAPYLDALWMLHAQRHPERPPVRTGGVHELLGHALSSEMAADIAAIDLFQGSRASFKRAFVLDSASQPETRALAEALTRAGVNAEHVSLPERAVAQREWELNTSLLASGTLQAIAERLGSPLS